jgi:hypothetical protein
VQQDGVVRMPQAHASMAAEPLLDLGARMLPIAPDFDERGLLGFALHPKFARGGSFFVSCSAPLRAGALGYQASRPLPTSITMHTASARRGAIEGTRMYSSSLLCAPKPRSPKLSSTPPLGLKPAYAASVPPPVARSRISSGSRGP